MAITPKGKRHARLWLPAVKNVLVWLSRSGRYRRIQADAVKEFEAGNRFLVHLGFKKESEMPKYGPNGETFVRYVYG